MWKRGLIHSKKGVIGSGRGIGVISGGEYDHNALYTYMKLLNIEQEQNEKRQFCYALNGLTGLSQS